MCGEQREHRGPRLRDIAWRSGRERERSDRAEALATCGVPMEERVELRRRMAERRRNAKSQSAADPRSIPTERPRPVTPPQQRPASPQKTRVASPGAAVDRSPRALSPPQVRPSEPPRALQAGPLGEQQRVGSDTRRLAGSALTSVAPPAHVPRTQLPRVLGSTGQKLQQDDGAILISNGSRMTGSLKELRSGGEVPPVVEVGRSGYVENKRRNGNGTSAALAAAGRSIESVGNVAGSAVAVVASTAGSVATAAADTAGSAAVAAAAAAGSVARAAASATGCLPATESALSRIDLLCEVPLFSGLSRAHMEQIVENMEVVDVDVHDVVIRQGDEGDEMYLVETGLLEVSIASADGEINRGVKKYTNGAFFGELAILSEEHSKRSATVTALEPSRLLILRRQSVATLLKQQGLYQTLSIVPMFKDLSILELHHIGNSMSKQKVAPGEIVIRQGDKGDAMFVVESGRLEASVREGDKDLGVVRTYGGGEYFGELALQDEEPRGATVTATDESTLLVLKRAVVTKLLQSGAREIHVILTQHHRLLCSGPLAHALACVLAWSVL